MQLTVNQFSFEFRGSSPFTLTKSFRSAVVAQLTVNQLVVGSNPSESANIKSRCRIMAHYSFLPSRRRRFDSSHLLKLSDGVIGSTIDFDSISFGSSPGPITKWELA